MTLQKIKNLLTSNYYQTTKLDDAYKYKDYPEKLEIKNSSGRNLALLFGIIIFALFLITITVETEIGHLLSFFV